ncbi:MAG: CHASE2 domain-containing protein [Smithellaceae bacterium]
MKPVPKSIISDFRHGILLTLLALFIVIFFWSSLERFEYGLYDLGSRLRVKPTNAPVCIVTIDDRSIDALGPWPWPRSYIGFMIDLLESYEAKVIGLNIIYSDKDLNRGLKEIINIINTIENNPQYSEKNIGMIVLLAALKDAEKRLDNDAILADSIASSKKVVLPLLFHLGNSKNNAEINYPDYLLANSLFPFPHNNSIIAGKISVPIDIFAQEAQRLGHVNILADNDGIVRRETLFLTYQERIHASFALQLSLSYLNLDLGDLVFGKNVAFGQKSIPLIKQNKMLISFKSDFPRYSFVDVINKKIAANAFQNKIVIIAPTAAGVGEYVDTPVASALPSVNIITNIIDNILNNDYITRPEWAFVLELMVIFFFGLYIALVVPRLKAVVSGFISCFLILIWLIGGLYLMVAYGYWIRAVYPALVLFIGYIVIMSKRYKITPKVDAG